METYSIQELKGILTEKQNEIVASFKEIIIEGDLKLSRQPWKKGNRFGIFFDLVDQQESFQCKLWTSSSSEFERINTLQYKKVKCQGEITLNKIYGNFQFRVHSIELCIDKESYLEELKKECLLRNYFIEKKKIDWFSIQNIGFP